MKKVLIGLATLPILAGVAMAGQPTPLSDAQMDKVTAGFNVDYTLTGGTILEFENGFADPGQQSLSTLHDEIELSAGGLPFSLSPDPK